MYGNTELLYERNLELKGSDSFRDGLSNNKPKPHLPSWTSKLPLGTHITLNGRGSLVVIHRQSVNWLCSGKNTPETVDINDSNKIKPH